MSERRSPHGRLARVCAILAALGGLALRAPDVSSQPVVPTGFTDLPMVPGLDAPVGMTFLPDGRLLVIEQKTAIIKLVIIGGTITVTPILTVPEVNTFGSEQGLLGIAVDPGWPARPYLYVHYDHSGDSRIRISRFSVTGDVGFTGSGSLAIDPASRYHLLTDIPDAASNHNGGTLRFGPDGMLYASLGDDAIRCAAQDFVSLRGVILRLDVSRLPLTPGATAPKGLIAAPGNPFAAHPDSNARLVWTLGLRNPFRFHIDMPTGDLFVADVGEGTWEEVSIVQSGGVNLGWPYFEGPMSVSVSCPDNNSGFAAPIHAYDGTGFSASIISAGLYRRPATGIDRFPSSYDGDYFFIDYFEGFLRRLTGGGSTWSIAPIVAGQPSSSDWGTGFFYVADWALGPSGALWYCRQFDDTFGPGTGAIGRISYASGAAPVITGVQATPETGGRSATIRWNTDIPADSRVDFGTDPGTLDRTASNAAVFLNHAVSLTGLEPETDYFYRVTSSAPAGGSDVEPAPGNPPLEFRTLAFQGPTLLLPPYPSPAIGSVTIPYDLAAASTVTMRLYDLRGRLVRTLIDGEPRGEGGDEVVWDGRDSEGRDVPAGVYVVRLAVGGFSLERRIAFYR